MDDLLKNYLAGITEKKLRTSDRHFISAKIRTNTEEHRRAHKEACNEKRDNTYQALDNARPEKRAQISATMKGMTKTAEHEAKVAASNKAKPTDPIWKAAHTAGLAKRDRPFHAGEYGVFPSLNAAARYVMEHGLLCNAVKKFEKWKKTDPNNYYFVEKR